jgi:hypothetical protein
MKELIEKSININGVANKNIKTIFDLNKLTPLTKESTPEQTVEFQKQKIENTKINNDINFMSLVKIKGRTLTIDFDYNDGEVKKTDKILLSIPNVDSQDTIKEFILNEINTKINK